MNRFFRRITALMMALLLCLCIFSAAAESPAEARTAETAAAEPTDAPKVPSAQRVRK